jgi:WD repeat-containing protein 35
VYTIPEGNDLLKDIGSKFATVGLSEQAARAFVKADDVKEAINACVRLNQWDLAVELADTHKVTEVGCFTFHQSQ